MLKPDASRQWRSARHYLADESLTARLQPTLALAARTLGFPAAMINILDQHTQHTIAVLGEGYPVSTPRSESLCDRVVSSGEPLVVEDARVDDRFSGLSTVKTGLLGAYVGVPLRGRESLPVGAVCVIDPDARVVDAGQLARLEQFGKLVEDQLDLIRRLHEQRGTGGVAAGELARAIADGEIVPWYQPIVDLPSGMIVGFEALARWEHPSGHVEDPDRFIPMAEDSDLVIELDLSVMRQALTDVRRWQHIDPGLKMNINLSSRHFDHPDWIVPIVAAVQAAGVSPETIALELTETARLSGGHSEGRFVHELQEHGFRVWLDDFGTGWSSLEYLLRLPADGLKIDRSFSVALGSRVGDALVRSVVALAHELGMQTVLEGIETRELADRAAGLGCDRGQGYLWSAPVRTEDVDELLRDLPRPRAADARASDSTATTTPSDDLRAVDGRLPPPPQWSVAEVIASAVVGGNPDATAVLDRQATSRRSAMLNGCSPWTTGGGPAPTV